MKRNLKSVCTLMAVFSAFLIAGCNSSSHSEPAKTVKVGAVLPLDGPWSSWGESAKVALDLAVESVNYYLRKDNLQLELVVENSYSDAGDALVALQSLHAKGVRAVIGPMSSDEAAAMVGYANANDMLLVSPSSTAVSLALPDNLFRMVPNDTNQVEALINLMTSQGITRLLPVYLNDPYGRDFEQLIRADTSGIEVLDAITYEVHTTDFGSVVSSIESAAETLASATTAILFIGRDSDAVQLFSSAGTSSPLADFKWYATDSIIREAAILNSPEARAFASKVGLEGFAFSMEATAPVVPTMLVTGLMSGKMGGTPSSASLGVWDALWFVAEAYRRDPDADTAGLIENFKSVVNNGGNFSSQTAKLDENGDMVQARYARFAVEEGSSGIRWNLKGMFIKSISAGTLILPATASPTHETGDAVIGVLLPLSGANAEQGVGAQQAINLALKHANDYYQHALGVDVNFIAEVRDTASNPDTALDQLKELHEELGIELFIGPIHSGELAAVRDYAEDEGIVIISTTSTAPSLAIADDRIMRLTPDDTRQAKAMSRLITAQDKQNVVLIYRNDVYGQGFVDAFSAIYEGNIDSYGYEPDTTNFTSVLDLAASVEALETPDDTAVLVVGYDEITSLLEQLQTGALTEVQWYGTDGISKSRTLLASPVAVAMAEKIQLTCSTYDGAATTFFPPAYHVLESKLAPLLGGPSTWNEISAYDALWISASAFAMTRPTANSLEIWTYLENLFATSGIYGIYLFNEHYDNIVSLYTFYTPEETFSGPVWTATAFYRDYYVAYDSLEIIGQ